jgi:uncharacterized protein YndB with AHSA1/START domain
MTTSSSAAAADHDPTRDLVITRYFDAPRERVYQAFLDPDQLAQWFGPVGYSVPRESIDVDNRVGGHQRFVMVSDDDPSARSSINATFVELVENELIVGAEDVDGIPGTSGTVRMMLRVELSDEGGRTKLVLRQGPQLPDMHGNARLGWESSFTKLDALLTSG